MDEELDVNAEMRRIIDAETANGPYVSSVVAKRIVLKLRDTNPELLFEWLNGQAEPMIRSAINQRDASLRAHARHTAKGVAFGKAAKQYAEGDTSALGTFVNAPFVTAAEGLRKHLGEMNSKELRFAASSYENRAKHNTMQAVFLNVLADALRANQKVVDKFDEITLSKIWLSIMDNVPLPDMPKSRKKATGPRTVKTSTGGTAHPQRSRIQ